MERERVTDLDRARRSLEIQTNGLITEREVPLPDGQLSAEEALEIAIEAYVYAYPLVLMDVTRVASTSAAAADGMRGLVPMNQFAHAPALPDARFTGVARPNVDTLQSSLWFDVSEEPLILGLPDSGGRYYVLSMFDLWTDVFAAPGKRTTGTGPQWYAIVGPRWSGRLPDGVEPLRSPTSLGWIVARAQTNGGPDLGDVHAFQAGLRAAPLSAFGRATAVPPGSGEPPVSIVPPLAPVNQVARMDGATLFSRFAALTADNPPHPNDYPQLQRMQRLGIVPGMPVTKERLSHNAWIALDRAIPFAQRRIRDHATRAARIMNGWVMMTSPIGTYGTDYLKRALIAFMGLGASPVEDAIFPTAFTMADGSPFPSDAKYEVRFPNNGLPPARAFWSLTMYNDRQLFADNPIGRYAIGDRDPLRFDSDGSLMLYIQRESPGRDKESNWLPTPKQGAFTMTLRLYWPEPAALDGTWAPPLVKRVGEHYRATRR
jgi:hypothetical protein